MPPTFFHKENASFSNRHYQSFATQQARYHPPGARKCLDPEWIFQIYERERTITIFDSSSVVAGAVNDLNITEDRQRLYDATCP